MSEVAGVIERSIFMLREPCADDCFWHNWRWCLVITFGFVVVGGLVAGVLVRGAVVIVAVVLVIARNNTTAVGLGRGMLLAALLGDWC